MPVLNMEAARRLTHGRAWGLGHTTPWTNTFKPHRGCSTERLPRAGPGDSDSAPGGQVAGRDAGGALLAPSPQPHHRGRGLPLLPPPWSRPAPPCPPAAAPRGPSRRYIRAGWAAPRHSAEGGGEVRGVPREGTSPPSCSHGVAAHGDQPRGARWGLGDLGAGGRGGEARHRGFTQPLCPSLSCRC